MNIFGKLPHLALLAAASLAVASCTRSEEQIEAAGPDVAEVEPDTACNVGDVEYRGQSTYYAATGGGACSFAPSPDDLMVVALNPQEFAGSSACGACIEVDGPDGSVTARVVDLCPGCAAGDIDLSAEAFAAIAEPKQGRVAVAWRFVACPVEGAISYHFKEGSNPWWTAIQVRNHRHPIATLQVRAQGGDYQSTTRSNYNYFIADEGGLGEGPYDIRVTDTLGQVLEDHALPFAPDTLVEGDEQFPGCKKTASKD